MGQGAFDCHAGDEIPGCAAGLVCWMRTWAMKAPMLQEVVSPGEGCLANRPARSVLGRPARVAVSAHAAREPYGLLSYASIDRYTRPSAQLRRMVSFQHAVPPAFPPSRIVN